LVMNFPVISNLGYYCFHQGVLHAIHAFFYTDA
jgi:hypothetical protein